MHRTSTGFHVAVLKGRSASRPAEAEAGAVAPTFRIDNIEAFAAEFVRQGVERVHKIADIGVPIQAASVCP